MSKFKFLSGDSFITGIKLYLILDWSKGLKDWEMIAVVLGGSRRFDVKSSEWTHGRLHIELDATDDWQLLMNKIVDIQVRNTDFSGKWNIVKGEVLKFWLSKIDSSLKNTKFAWLVDA